MTHAITLDIQEILRYLPHRYPFLLLDKIITLKPGYSIIGLKNVTMNEPFFQGHFPSHPIMPGVLILEAMAQTTGILALYSDDPNQREKSLYLLAAIDQVKFKSQVIPGDQLQMKAEIQWAKAHFLRCAVSASVDNRNVCTAVVTGARKPI